MVAVEWFQSIRQSPSSRTQVMINGGHFKGSVGDVLKYGKGKNDNIDYYLLLIVNKQTQSRAVVPANVCRVYGMGGVPLFAPSMFQPTLASLVQHGGVGGKQLSSGVRIAAPPDAAPTHSATTENIGLLDSRRPAARVVRIAATPDAAPAHSATRENIGLLDSSQPAARVVGELTTSQKTAPPSSSSSRQVTTTENNGSSVSRMSNERNLRSRVNVEVAGGGSPLSQAVTSGKPAPATAASGIHKMPIGSKRKGSKSLRNSVNRASMCRHGRRKTRCSDCGVGKSLCVHLKQKGWCNECKNEFGSLYYGDARKRVKS